MLSKMNLTYNEIEQVLDNINIGAEINSFPLPH